MLAPPGTEIAANAGAVPARRTDASPGKAANVATVATVATVAVVGTGIVGLATALGCAQQGVPVRLIGPAPRAVSAQPRAAADADTPAWDARIYALSPAAAELLERQRVWQQVDPARVCAVTRMRVRGDDGGELCFDAHAAGVPRLATICEESELLKALWLGCSLAPGVEHVPQTFASARFDAHPADANPIELRLADGSSLACALLAGADGKRSSVRAAAGISAVERSYGHTAVVANFAAERPHHGTAFQWFTDEGVVALLPLPGERASLVWSAPHALAAELMQLSPDQFCERVARRGAHALGALRLIGDRHSFPLDRVAVDRLVRPGAVLLGDAAHVVHPLAGQGLNLGLQDVSEFLRLLALREAWRSPGDHAWLRRFARARAEPIALMRGTVDALARLFDARDPRVRRLRNLGMSAVDAIAPLKHVLVRQAIGGQA